MTRTHKHKLAAKDLLSGFFIFSISYREKAFFLTLEDKIINNTINSPRTQMK
jgi:hypothetical protein